MQQRMYHDAFGYLKLQLGVTLYLGMLREMQVYTKHKQAARTQLCFPEGRPERV